MKQEGFGPTKVLFVTHAEIKERTPRDQNNLPILLQMKHPAQPEMNLNNMFVIPPRSTQQHPHRYSTL